MKFLGVEITVEEFDFLMCEQSKGKELKVVDGKVVALEKALTDVEIAEQRISELKVMLSNSDYKAIKFAEGLISQEDYVEIKNQRQYWREQINLLEKTILKANEV